MPKGRKNANESVERAGEREGFEETGYRNRLIPLPMKHRQPDPDVGHPEFVTEPLWTQFLPLSATSQYLLFWYAAETVPPEVERSYAVSQSNVGNDRPPIYQHPPRFPEGLSLKRRIAMDNIIGENGQQTIYEPVHVQGTAQDDEERMYESHFLTIADARRKLKGSVMEDVVRRGWDAIQLRMKMEDTRIATSS